ncbi:MAG TPA: flagellar M-ring protein FliF C-terminal domain-containing protein [Coleofasciculaceae cyanobacterium]|jgi:flagellar M-ring protein FliF
MPPKIQELLQNRNALIGIAVVLVVVVVVIGMAVLGGGGKQEAGGDPEAIKPLTEDQKEVATVASIGQAMEIQALLAQHGVRLQQKAGDGGKTVLKFMEGATQKDRDMAILTLVQSGLMDKNVGLEAFEKGDLTASREEKRIKLIRSQQGEMARLIRKIKPIQDANVTIAIPEQTLFRSEEKPISASVQLSLLTGQRLTRDQVRAITNLMVGSIQGLEARRVSISDTNGNTYNSVLDTGDEMNEKLSEQDEYMRQKVATQLDRLVGAGNYVVTVSTELRQAPRETLVQSFDPQGAVVSTKQSFNENLNTAGRGPGSGGPTSTVLPNTLSSTMLGGTPNKDYARHGVEVAYSNSKTQWLETQPVGMLEDISIAVTIDSSHFPTTLGANELQELLAHAASPKVRPQNVTIAQSNLSNNTTPLVHTDTPAEVKQDMTWLYWAGGAVLFCVLMIMMLSIFKGGKAPSGEDMVQTQRELQQLRDLASQQQAQLQATQQQTQMILEAQQQQMQQLQSQPQQAAIPQNQEAPRIPISGGSELQQTLDELREVVTGEELEDDNLDLQIKTWIESS